MESMTLQEAKEILRTYKLPMTDDQLKKFKIALKVVCGLCFN